MRRRECDVGVSVDVGHLGRLNLPVYGIVLDNAQGIYPEAIQADSKVEADSVTEVVGISDQGMPFIRG